LLFQIFQSKPIQPLPLNQNSSYPEPGLKVLGLGKTLYLLGLSQATRPSKHITVQDLPTQLIELSEKDLQQIVGGGEPASAPIGGGKKQD